MIKEFFLNNGFIFVENEDSFLFDSQIIAAYGVRAILFNENLQCMENKYIKLLSTNSSQYFIMYDEYINYLLDYFLFFIDNKLYFYAFYNKKLFKEFDNFIFSLYKTNGYINNLDDRWKAYKMLKELKNI